MKLLQFIIAKSLAGSVRNLVVKEVYKDNKKVIREKLGFDSIDEFMRATPEEIRERQAMMQGEA